jgi:hypothetical protein
MTRLPLLSVLLAASFSGSALPVAAAPCPPAAAGVIDGLYRWVKTWERANDPLNLASQAQRFTPALNGQLNRALALTPADGRFVDFNIFNGTQVSTFGARVLGCAPSGGVGLEAWVAVRVGISSRTAEEPPQTLRFRLVPGAGGRWQIADIVYPGTPELRLSTYLADLLKPRP